MKGNGNQQSQVVSLCAAPGHGTCRFQAIPGQPVPALIPVCTICCRQESRSCTSTGLLLLHTHEPSAIPIPGNCRTQQQQPPVSGSLEGRFHSSSLLGNLSREAKVTPNFNCTLGTNNTDPFTHGEESGKLLRDLQDLCSSWISSSCLCERISRIALS